MPFSRDQSSFISGNDTDKACLFLEIKAALSLVMTQTRHALSLQISNF